ncbi:MAG: hypothetical protein WBB48_08470 [Thermodesulfobacteriota bacterium]
MTIENRKTFEPQTPNYSDKCGYSLKPLNTIHKSKTCQECSKIIFFSNTKEDNNGIIVKPGEELNIPLNNITLSLDPTSGGKLYKPGLEFLIKNLLFDGGPSNIDEPLNLDKYYEQKFDSFLRESPLLKHLNLDSKEDAKKAIDILSNEQETREWWAFVSSSAARASKTAINKNDALTAAKAMYIATNAHAMTVVKEQTFEDTLWRGYLANKIVYECAAANTPAESEAIQKLGPLFSKLEESVLHTWVNDGKPIGPRIEVKEISEETLLALAEWHLRLFSRKRDDKLIQSAEKRANSEIWIKGIGLGVSATIAIGTVIVGILKYYGVL